MFFSESFGTIFHHFISPEERLYWPVLLFSVFLAWLCLWLGGKNRPLREIREQLLSWKIWTHPSSVVDMKLFLFNNLIRFIFLALIANLIISSHSLSLSFLRFLRFTFGENQPVTTNRFVISFSYTLFSFVLLDALRFLQHYLMHHVSFLWYFHKVHHRAEVLTPLTLHRMHPFEMFIGMARSCLAVALSSGLYVYLFQVPLHGIDILGVNIFGFLFNALGANLRHSHIWMSFGFLEYLFISPAQHQIHHSQSREHHNKNLGICLSIWDIALGSFLRAHRRLDLKFGLTSFQEL